MSLDYRFARADEYPRISGFLDQHWAHNHVYCRDQHLFEWTFRRPSHWHAGELSFALAEDEGRLAGILGGIPFTFNCHGRASRGVWIANYVIGPEHRKGPAALALLSMFRSPEFNPVVAFGINPATAVIYRVLRGQVLPEIPRHFLVLPESIDRMTTFLRVAHPGWEPERARELASRFVVDDAGWACPETYYCLPGSWDRIDWPRLAEQTVGAVRDTEYLTWRYRLHPNFEYRFITIPDGQRTGLAVWRLEKIRRLNGDLLEVVDSIGRLVEFIPVSKENAAYLLAAFVHELRQAGGFGADFYCYHGPTRAVLEEMGFRDVGAHPAGTAIPSRFQPLDGKDGRILSAIFMQPDVPACSTGLDCPWYWTKSDSDQDRPN